MSDYIERQAAIETLDEQVALCDKALKSFDISLKDEYAVKVERASLVAYKEQLEALPSADVVQVVRCENCIHWSDSNQCARPELSGNRWHDAKYFDTLPDDYCSYGERREE